MDKDKIYDIVNKLKNSKLSSYYIAQKTSITEMSIGNYRKGKTIPTAANAKILEVFFDELDNSTTPNESIIDNSKQLIDAKKTAIFGIPLINVSAAAGFGNANFAITEQDVKECYVIPKFKNCKVDFMLEISGSSMYPKYSSGDIVACTILHDRTFIQWNKCHIIATREQGILCKRLFLSDKENHITAVSDNKNYPPFDIPEKEITGIALVIGVIRLE